MRLARPRTQIVALVTLLGLLALVLSRVASEARSELDVADAYRDEGRVGAAVEHYRRALRWSYPLSSVEKVAVSRLEVIAAQFEAEEDWAAALMAWRSLSGGLAATRSFYVAENPNRAHANLQIARLAAMEHRAGIDAGSSEAQVAADHLRLLSEDVSPDPWWGSLLLFGMAGWVGALAIVARRGFDTAGRLRWSTARVPVSAAMIGFISFVLGLLFA